jgi:hypothetical protein
VRIEPGDTVFGYLSPKWDYELPAGRYQISVRFLQKVPGKDAPQEIESNRITRPLPEAGPQALEGGSEFVLR